MNSKYYGDLIDQCKHVAGDIRIENGDAFTTLYRAAWALEKLSGEVEYLRELLEINTENSIEKLEFKKDDLLIYRFDINSPLDIRTVLEFMDAAQQVAGCSAIVLPEGIGLETVDKNQLKKLLEDNDGV